jgi:prepilin-type N-terminal cleavage/methylation domain-containing protein
MMKSPATPKGSTGFTLLEVVISMMILALLAGAVYAVVSASITASQTAMSQQLTLRRLDAFLRVTREAFLNLPAEGTVTLQIGHSQNGSAEQDLVIGKAQQIFGLPSLAGGDLVLAGRPRPDGTRTITLLKIPANATDRERTEAFAAKGVPLLPHLRKPRWTFKFTPQDEDWKEELPAGSAKPILVRLQTDIDELPNPVEAIFYLPPVVAVPAETSTNAGGTNSTNSTPAP